MPNTVPGIQSAVNKYLHPTKHPLHITICTPDCTCNAHNNPEMGVISSI